MDSIRKSRCPYLASIGQKEIRCELHAALKNKKTFNNEKELRQYLDAVCYADFDTCEVYKKIYIEQMRSRSPYHDQYKKHAYCCNNSGYTGLKEHDGSSHGYCQLHEKEIEKYGKDICEYFNKLKRDGECPYFNGKAQDGRKPQIRCGHNALLSCFGEDAGARDKHVKDVCQGKYINCRPFLMRQLDRMGAKPEASWSTQEAREMYLKLKGSEEMPKRTYWTKCGRQFEKNSTAAVTGYTIDENDPQCANCPFQVEVTEGWGENKKHVRWECRAGSKEPNHTNDWIGSLEDKNTIHIRSLDNDFLEAILEYCEDQPELSAGYNQDLDDCRRVISISCSQNKKGVAAKKALIEKFFPATEAVPDERYEDEDTDQCNKYDCPFNDWEGNCCFADEDPESDGYKKDVIEAVKEYDCKNEDVLLAYKIIEDPDSCDLLADDKSLFDERRCRICGCTEDNACPGGCYWVLDDLCSNCVMTFKKTLEICRNCKDEDKGCIPKEYEAGKCPVFQKKEEIKNMSAENAALEVVTSKDIKEFDYSTVDEETAAFLQEKAARITEIRIKSVVAIGKELKEAQDKLSNHRTGTFGAWVQSVGLSRQTAQNYIQAYDYIVKNFDNIEAAENIQPSLLFAISKPSAPKELQEAVLAGDITSHKQYKELEAKLRETENRLQAAKEATERQAKYADEHMMRARKAEQEIVNKEKAMESLRIEISNLKQQVDQIKRNSDPAKLQELGQIIQEKQHEIQDYQKQIGQLNTKLGELQKQLKDKPIEVPAVQTVEKEIIPDEVALAIYDKVARLYEGLERLTDKEIQVFAEEVDPDYYDAVADSIDNAIEMLKRIKYLAYRETHKDITSEPEGHCGDCAHADMDQVSEEELDEGKTRCTLTGQVVDIMDRCGQYKDFRGETA